MESIFAYVENASFMYGKYLQKIWKNVGHSKLKLLHTKKLSCLAFHPSERIIAAGDVTGRIMIWKGFGDRTFAGDNGLPKKEDEKPGVRGDGDADSCTIWHWHFEKVKFLFFSSDGAYLYSARKGGILVVWQLDTGKKLLPRIGTPLLRYLVQIIEFIS